MAGVEWFYGKDNKQQGPISAAQLKQLAESGHLQPTDLVWREGMAEWMAASKVKGLFDETPPVAAVRPGPPPEVASQEPPSGATPAQPWSGASPPDATAASPEAAVPRPRAASMHPLDLALQYVRTQFTDRFLEATEKLFTVGGHYGLYVAMVLVLGFAVIGGVRMNDLNVVLGSLALAIGLAILQYAAVRFSKALDGLNRSTSGKLGSTTVPDCYALLSMIVGVIALLGLAVAAVQTEMFILFLPGVVQFILCQYLAIVAVNLGSLNIEVEPGARAGEEALGIFSFAIKVWIRLVPVAFGVGVACGAIVLMVACGLAFKLPAAGDVPNMGGSGAITSSLLTVWLSGVGLVAVSAALPLIAYVFFVFAHLGIDIIRAVLAIPATREAEKETG